MKHKKPIYTGILLDGTLNAHLEEIDRSAIEMFAQLVDEMADQEGVTEQLKAENQIAWVGQMNNISERTMDTVMQEPIFE